MYSIDRIASRHVSGLQLVSRGRDRVGRHVPKRVYSPQGNAPKVCRARPDIDTSHDRQLRPLRHHNAAQAVAVDTLDADKILHLVKS